MIKINLPPGFKEKLLDMQELEGIVISTISEYGDILSDNKLYFFEEYTDHGVKHIENTLKSASNLVTAGTLDNVLSGKDIACFILSVVLHDIAMHITPDGLNQLLNGQFDDIRVKKFDKHTWSQLWNDYLNEARKFNDKQLTAIFGDPNIIIREPPLQNRGAINGNDKKLAGEFIRRHHARLAHEIALKGFPGKDQPLTFAAGLDNRHKHLVGLIARSHGLALRTCIDYIESAYGIKTRRYIDSIHIVFLMVLLRLADYLQIDRTRTSATLLKLKTIASPFSENEHKAHLSIDFIDSEYQDDPERIFVHASPKDSSMYLKICKLLQDIQHEFDISWAVLGELYGNIANKPEIKYRRITSNLHEKDFYTKQAYVPDNFNFRPNDDIAKLLIAPLYGNHPKYGVRELLQNAVDACREREIHEKNANNNYKGEIVIKVYEESDGSKYFEIRDNGVGMTIATIKDYFLTAGASYRKSFDWQKAFIDAAGDSTVSRSGRFGVGVLAAFLIGQSIYLETRNINSDTGYKFSTDLNTDQINILKDQTIKAGTFIRIRIDNPLFQLDARPDWADWYVLSEPSIKYECLGKRVRPHFRRGPDPQRPGKEWHSLDTKGYNKIFWTYDHAYWDKRQFVCNGIVISKPFDNVRLDLSPFDHPRISILDNNALLPLTLDREKLSGQVSFEKDLREEIGKDFLAYMLLFTPLCQVQNGKIILGNQDFKYPGISASRMRYCLVSKKGFLFLTNLSASKANVLNIIEIVAPGLHTKFKSIDLDIQDTFFRYEVNDHYTWGSFYSDWWKMEDPPESQYDGRRDTLGSRAILTKDKYDQLFAPDKSHMSSVQKAGKIAHENENIIRICFGEPDISLIDKPFLEKYSEDITIIKEHRINAPVWAYLPGRPGQYFDTIDKLMEKYLGDNVIIPYAMEERKKLYPLAFVELEYYMLKHKERLKYIKDPDLTFHDA